MPKENLIDIESYIDVESMVEEFSAQNIVIDSTNDDYIREAMIAMATAAENYYRSGILDTIEKLKNLKIYGDEKDYRISTPRHDDGGV